MVCGRNCKNFNATLCYQPLVQNFSECFMFLTAFLPFYVEGFTTSSVSGLKYGLQFWNVAANVKSRKPQTAYKVKDIDITRLKETDFQEILQMHGREHLERTWITRYAYKILVGKFQARRHFNIRTIVNVMGQKQDA